MKKYIYKTILGVVATFFGYTANAQCPTIVCPTNITVNNDAGNCDAVVTYTAPVGVDLCTTGSQTFNYTGAVQMWTVPAGVTSVTISAQGAQGGSNAMGIVGGLGGSATGDLAVTPGDVLNIYVGGTNGYNGGGTTPVHPCANARGGEGGGASDVRLNGTTLGLRVIVGAGGGGAGGSRIAGCGRGSGGAGGGGYYGGGGGAGTPQTGSLPTGGTQVAGGSGGTSSVVSQIAPCIIGLDGVLGIGGDGGCEITSNQSGSDAGFNGGIGGGLSGASGIHPGNGNYMGQSGAGGSSYIVGLTSASTTSGTQSGLSLIHI